MGLFDKIKGQLLKVIAWEDDTTNTLVYRFPMEGKAIMIGSKLTVRPSQTAIFVNRGKIADVFGPGEYDLQTRNLPFLTAIGDVFYQGENRFKADVYFVSTKQFTGLQWGTASPITIRDNDFGMVRIRSYGVYGFRMDDPTKLLEELFGTNSTFEVEDITEHLKSILISSMTDTIAESHVSALDMAMNLRDFNAKCVEVVQSNFKELGLKITNFTIENINFPEEIEKAIDQRATLGILGDKMGTYTQKAAADALGAAAKNPGGTAGMFVGMGMGANAGGILGQTMGGNIANAQDKPKESNSDVGFCSSCGAKVNKNAKFCPECGAKLSIECPNCHKAIKEGVKFCPDCGTKIE
ncbi:MAG: SPFH domain-containing protein [Clostridia bacterium]